MNSNQSPPCDSCGEDAFSTLFTATDFDTGTEDFKLQQCNQCRLVRTSPVLSDDQLGHYYHQEYYGSAKQKFSRLIENWTEFTYALRAKKVLKLLRYDKPSPIEVLDIGCGRAHLLKKLSEHNCQCVGIERGEFPPRQESNIHIYNNDFLAIDFAEQKFDVVIVWHVLEHLLKPSQTITKISSLLKPGGKLLLAVPNFGGLQAKLFKKHWFHLDLPRHTYHFSIDTLTKILDNNELSVENICTWSFDQSVYGFIQSFLNATKLFPPNDFYQILKHQKKNRFSISTLAQILLALLASPIAIIEFLFSGVINNGSCIVIEAQCKANS